MFLWSKIRYHFSESDKKIYEYDMKYWLHLKVSFVKRQKLVYWVHVYLVRDTSDTSGTENTSPTV